MLFVDNICVFALFYLIYFMICITIIYQFSSFAVDISLSIIYAFYYIIIQGGCYSYTLVFNNHLTQTILIPFYQIAQFIYTSIISSYIDFFNMVIQNSRSNFLLKLELITISTTSLYIFYKVSYMIYAVYKIMNQRDLFHYNEDCCICYQKFNDSSYDEIEILKCRHAFHTSCMSKFIIFHKSQQSLYYKKEGDTINCPHCRAPIFPKEICGS